jgi:two-component system, chemotaxis family, protein-glutamate methylesterase/glutaminase
MIASATPIRVMVVDDSVVIRGLLGRIVDAEADMRVVASAPNGRSALDLLRLKPVDVVLLDIEMPEMDGLTALPLIVADHPAVRVIMASSLTAAGAEVTIKALSLGAADYITKPSSRSLVNDAETVARELVSKIRALGRASRSFPAPRIAGATASNGSVVRDHVRRAPARVVAIAASTGGPNALGRVLVDLGPEFPLPIVIVQHMPQYFTAVLASRLERESGRECREAVNGEMLLGGRTYVAPGDYHLVLAQREAGAVLHLSQSAPVHYCRPSADPMFRSVAKVFGKGVLAVVLTGMGEDGAAGCRDVVAAGGQVIVQDAATSVVWGMPGSVANAGLASAVLPLDRIGSYVLDACTVAV